MTGYVLAEVDRQAVGTKFVCLKCENILRDPVQTICGHRYCSTCMEAILRAPPSTCVVDKTEIKHTQVFIDKFAQREILSLLVKCTLHSEGCEWSGELKDMEVHQTACLFVSIPCKNSECQTLVQRKNLALHLEQECSFRKELCTLCGGSVSFAQMEEHQKSICPSFPVECEKCKVEIPRAKLSQHIDPEEGDCEAIETLCPFQPLGCQNGNKLMHKKEKKIHLEKEVVGHVNFLLAFMQQLSESMVTSSGGMEPIKQNPGILQAMDETIQEALRKVDATIRKHSEMVPKLKEQDQRIKRLEDCMSSAVYIEDDLVPDTGFPKSIALSVKPKVGGDTISRRMAKNESKADNHEFLLVEMNKKFEAQQHHIRKLERQLESAQDIIRKLERRVESHDYMMTMRNVALTDLEEFVRQRDVSSYNGVLLWRINDFARRKKDAITGKQTSFYSPCFYTSRDGYKMCVRIYLHGDGMGKDTHISVFFVVMRGEYDALLRWPFRQKVTMMLLDQDNAEHVIDAFRPDPVSASFQRPRREMNIASGCPLFCALTELNKHAYVRDDTMFMKIIVDTSDL